jgi:hypothetical protein
MYLGGALMKEYKAGGLEIRHTREGLLEPGQVTELRVFAVVISKSQHPYSPAARSRLSGYHACVFGSRSDGTVSEN